MGSITKGRVEQGREAGAPLREEVRWMLGPWI